MVEYHAAIQNYSDAVFLLFGTAPLEEHRRLRQNADRLRLQSERTRLALERHIAEHGC